MTNAPELGQRRKINWLHVNTVLSAAILIGAEVFGAAYAGGWAIAMLFGFGDLGIISPARRVLHRRPRGDDLVHPASVARRAVHVASVTSRERRARAPSALALKKFSPRVRFLLIVTA